MSEYRGGISVTLYGAADEVIANEYVLLGADDLEGAVLAAATKVLQAAAGLAMFQPSAGRVRDGVEAKCLNCGTLWPMQRGDGFRCPYCNVEFTKVYMRATAPRYMEFDGLPAL